VDNHSPKKASLYSAMVPGAGQFYNKKLWKIPIIYAGIGTALYAAQWNQKEYLHYREAYEYRTDEDETTIDPYEDQFTESNLITIKNYRRKNRDLAYIITAGIYLLNIIDASVDAHLFKFNVNEDISLNIQPQFMQANYQNIPALSLKLNWN
jgi:hypothetical protein